MKNTKNKNSWTASTNLITQINLQWTPALYDKAVILSVRTESFICKKNRWLSLLITIRLNQDRSQKLYTGEYFEVKIIQNRKASMRSFGKRLLIRTVISSMIECSLLNWKVERSIPGHWVNRHSAPWARAFASNAQAIINRIRLWLSANCR